MNVKPIKKKKKYNPFLIIKNILIYWILFVSYRFKIAYLIYTILSLP